MKRFFKKLSVFLIAVIIISTMTDESGLPNNPSSQNGIAETMDKKYPKPEPIPGKTKS